MSDDVDVQEPELDEVDDYSGAGESEEHEEQQAPKRGGRRRGGSGARRIIDKYLELSTIDSTTLARAAHLLGQPADAIDVTDAIFAGRFDKRPATQVRQYLDLTLENALQAGMTVMGLEPKARKQLWQVLVALGWAEGAIAGNDLTASMTISEVLQRHTRDGDQIDELLELLEAK